MIPELYKIFCKYEKEKLEDMGNPKFFIDHKDIIFSYFFLIATTTRYKSMLNPHNVTSALSDIDIRNEIKNNNLINRLKQIKELTGTIVRFNESFITLGSEIYKYFLC